MSTVFHSLSLAQIVIWHPHSASPQSYLWWQKKVLSWNGYFIIFLPVAIHSPLSIYIHYCRCRNSVGFHYFIGMGSSDSGLLSVLTHFLPFSTSIHRKPPIEKTKYTMHNSTKSVVYHRLSCHVSFEFNRIQCIEKGTQSSLGKTILFFLHHTFKNWAIIANTLNVHYIIIMGNFDFFQDNLLVMQK